MHGVFNQGWAAAFSASLVTLRKTLSDDGADEQRVDAIPPRGRSAAGPARVATVRTGRKNSRGAVIPRRVISEDLFKDVLVREWKRGERFSQPFVLLLVELHEDAAVQAWANARGEKSGLSAVPIGSSWSRVVSALSACTRTTDVMGWFVQRS